MVKFSKELEAQLIPEWKDKFVNYWQLKKHVKNIKLSRKLPKQTHVLHHHNNHDFGLSIFDPLRFVRDRISDMILTNSDIVQVKNKVAEDGQEDEEVDHEEAKEHVHDETDLAHLLSEEDEVKDFFERLDEELNKVNQFYRTKEDEFVERGDILNKQLQILVDLKQILSERRGKTSPRNSTTRSLPRSYSSSTRSSDYSESADEFSETPTPTQTQTDEVVAALERNGVNFISSVTRSKTKRGTSKPNMGMRIDIPVTTPTRTITAVTSMLWEDLVNNPKKEGTGDFINKKKIQCAEKMIRGAFVELYRGLGLLKTYSSLNMVGFTKILKKFDKVANQQASTNYLKIVKKSHFISSDKVVRLMDEVESIFTKHFANSDRKKAMKFLRPQQQKDSHMVTFFVGVAKAFLNRAQNINTIFSCYDDHLLATDSASGNGLQICLIINYVVVVVVWLWTTLDSFNATSSLFTGSFVTLFTLYAILAHLSEMFSPTAGTAYVESIYPVFSMFALLSLHLFMYGCNLFMWKRKRINYNFIFEFSSSTALKYRDAFLICTSVMTAVVGALVIHLILRANGFSPSQVDAIPGVLLLIFIVLLICPFNIFYRSTRYCFIRVIRNIICSPLYRVMMVDFFMADQLTSQIPLLRHMESTACYFLAGSFKTHQFDTCKSGKLYRELAYVISFLPYYWRAMQCARRWFDECDSNHLANMGKYVSAMVAAGARITYAKQQDHLWLAIVLVTSVVATVYQLYWDFVMDWGFFNTKSRNLWLRDDLVLKNKSIYYISIALNVVLRVVWVETVLRFRFGLVESRLLDFLLASLEVIRRGHWNFYRLENEHLNNVGKYRAVKTVPLPFRDSDSDG